MPQRGRNSGACHTRFVVPQNPRPQNSVPVSVVDFENRLKGCSLSAHERKTSRCPKRVKRLPLEISRLKDAKASAKILGFMVLLD